MRSIKGFVLSQYLITLIAGAVLMHTMVISIFLSISGLTFAIELQDEIGIQQLRRLLLLSYDMCCMTDCVSFEYKNEKYTLQYVNENLIMQPGTQIFLTDVDACTFVQYGRDLYMEYVRDGKVYERFLYES